MDLTLCHPAADYFGPTYCQDYYQNSVVSQFFCPHFSAALLLFSDASSGLILRFGVGD